MDIQKIDIKMIERRIKEIFAKDHISKDDLATGLYFLDKWKKLNNYKDEE